MQRKVNRQGSGCLTGHNSHGAVDGDVLLLQPGGEDSKELHKNHRQKLNHYLDLHGVQTLKTNMQNTHVFSVARREQQNRRTKTTWDRKVDIRGPVACAPGGWV